MRMGRGVVCALALVTWTGCGTSANDRARTRYEARKQAEGERGAAFLAKAASEPGAVKTRSGMVYQELRKGSGDAPSPSDVVLAHYRGTLVDGTPFDSSYERGAQPARFPLDAVIKCWREGLPMMQVGGKARLVCPPELAYGNAGSGTNIPANATLDFEIELVGIQPR